VAGDLVEFRRGLGKDPYGNRSVARGTEAARTIREKGGYEGVITQGRGTPQTNENQGAPGGQLFSIREQHLSGESKNVAPRDEGKRVFL